MKIGKLNYLHSAVAILVFGFSFYASGGIEDWPEWDRAELELTESKSGEEMKAEILLSRIILNDRFSRSAREAEFYKRIKVYQDSAIDDLSVIRGYFGSRYASLKEFEARVTNPDGKRYELGSDDWYEEVVSSKSGQKVKTRAFGLPQLVVGSVIEYGYKTTRGRRGLEPFVLVVAEDWPIAKLEVELKPSHLAHSTVSGFNGNFESRAEEGPTYYMVGSNIPAEINELYSPARLDVAPWIFLRYLSEGELDPETFWRLQSELLVEQTKERFLGHQKAVRNLAKELTKGSSDDNEKLYSIYRYCRNELRNLDDPHSLVTDAERAEMKIGDTPAETIKRGYGSSWDVLNVFGALVDAAGFEVSLARCEDREWLRFNPRLPSITNVPDEIVAVRTRKGQEWLFFDPGNSYLPFGYLDWENNGVPVLLGNRNEAALAVTQRKGASDSVQRRTADLTLSDQGELSGKVTVELTGYEALRLRRRLSDVPVNEWDEWHEDWLEGKYPDWVIDSVAVDGGLDWEKPLSFTFTGRIPEYAEKIGDRWVMRPHFLEADSRPIFLDTERKSDIQFPFPWMEEDEVRIALPRDFAVSEESLVGGGFDHGTLVYESRYDLSDAGGTLVLKRKLVVDAPGYAVESYDSVKRLFEIVNEQDRQSVLLEPKQ